MIDFFAHDTWSAVWLGCLILFGAATVMGRKRDARRILHVMVANWFLTRFCVYFLIKNPAALIALDVATFLALIVYGKTASAYVCAILFFAILQFDFFHHSGLWSFSDAAAVQDAIGFIILIIMAGAANDFWRDRLNGRPDLSHDRLMPHPLGLFFRGDSENDTFLAVEKTKGENK